jgi:DNA modification methylase
MFINILFFDNKKGGGYLKIQNNVNDLDGKEWLQNSISVWRDLSKTKEEKQFNHPASYPVSLCERLLKTFSKKGSNVIDPFAGIGSTLVACKDLERNCVGIELSKKYCEIAEKRINSLDLFNNKEYENISIINGDSFSVVKKIKDESFDLCLTSPPYWNILNMKRTADKKETINYSNTDADIGNIDDYDKFLNSLKILFSDIYRILKYNSYCLINVMDIRKKNIFYPLHSDLADKMKEIGFVYDDIIIWDRQNDYNNLKPLGYPYKFRINKVHEYILIFLKI